MNKELAIECIKTQRQFVDDTTREAFEIAIELLEQPKRPKGHWIHWSRSDECSNCGYNTGKYEEGSNYCPNCGARMDGEQK